MRQMTYSFIAVLVAGSTAFAHEGKPHDFADLSRAWSFDPLVVAILTSSAVIYINGLRNLWNAGGRGHGISRRICRRVDVGIHCSCLTSARVGRSSFFRSHVAARDSDADLGTVVRTRTSVCRGYVVRPRFVAKADRQCDL